MDTLENQNENAANDDIDPEDPAELATTVTGEQTEPKVMPGAEEILAENEKLRLQIEAHGGRKAGSILQKAGLEMDLKPFQAELILMQKYLEQTKRRMIILFEGLVASVKGGNIRGVTR